MSYPLCNLPSLQSAPSTFHINIRICDAVVVSGTVLPSLSNLYLLLYHPTKIHKESEEIVPIHYNVGIGGGGDGVSLYTGTLPTKLPIFSSPHPGLCLYV
jgi:hypothetical protein